MNSVLPVMKGYEYRDRPENGANMPPSGASDPARMNPEPERRAGLGAGSLHESRARRSIPVLMKPLHAACAAAIVLAACGDGTSPTSVAGTTPATPAAAKPRLCTSGDLE